MNTIREQFYENDIRAETIIHLGTMCLHDSWPDRAKEAFEYDAPDVWGAIGVLPSGMGGDAEDGWFPDLEQWEIEETLTQHGKLGWLVEFATPVPRDFYESGGYSFSWGHYRLTWFYGETFEACCQQAITWQAEFIKACREKAEQEAAAAEVQP